jgi:hypothetical protein
METNMSDESWANWLAEWEESLEYLYGSSTQAKPPAPRQSSEPIASGKDSKVYSFIRKVRSTAKATFFLTEDGIAGDFGFWCPKSAILQTKKNEVEIAKWCKLKIIQYTEY